MRSEDGQELLAVPDVLEHLEDVADVPVERVPERDRLGERVLVAEGDGDDRVERDEEEDRQPDDAREREQAPDPARAAPSTGLELRPGVVPVALALDGQLRAAPGWPRTGRGGRPPARASSGSGPRLISALRVDVLLRRRVAVEVDEVVVGVLLVEDEVEELVRERRALRAPRRCRRSRSARRRSRRAPRTRARRRHALGHVVEGAAEEVARPRVVEHRLALGQRLVVGDRDLRGCRCRSAAEVLACALSTISSSSVLRSGRTPSRIASRCIGMLSASRWSSRIPTLPRYACDCQKMSHGTSMPGDVLLDLVVAPADPVHPDDVRDRVARAAVVERVGQLGPDVLLEVRQVGVVERLEQLLRDQVDDVRAAQADDEVEVDRAGRELRDRLVGRVVGRDLDLAVELLLELLDRRRVDVVGVVEDPQRAGSRA